MLGNGSERLWNSGDRVIITKHGILYNDKELCSKRFYYNK